MIAILYTLDGNGGAFSIVPMVLLQFLFNSV